MRISFEQKMINRARPGRGMLFVLATRKLGEMVKYDEQITFWAQADSENGPALDAMLKWLVNRTPETLTALINILLDTKAERPNP